MKSAMLYLFSFNYLQALKAIPESSILYPILQNFQSIEAEKSMNNFFKKLAKHESNPYLKNALLFLSGPTEYSSILNSFSLLDSAGFALRFLGDSDLKTHLKELIEKGKSEGVLETLIISGFNQDTALILNKFFDSTGDLQNVGILSIYAQQFVKSEVLDNFASGYKYSLNRSELYHSRCLLDIEESKLLNKRKEKGKCIRCYYCGNSITVGDLSGSPNFAKRGDPQSVTKPVLNHCPSCANSLPRCSVCLNNLKSMNPHYLLDKSKGSETSVELFCWCEKCHHGGHTSHILEWFNEMNECPVYGCGCTCNSIDGL